MNMSDDRANRLRRILDAVDERHDEKPADVSLTWGELRELLHLRDEGRRWESGCTKWRAWVETLAVRLGIPKPEKLAADELKRVVASAATGTRKARGG